MFTGIIKTTGIVLTIKKTEQDARFKLTAKEKLHLNLGDSLAVDGCCLTVASQRGRHYYFDLSPETLAQTNLGAYLPGRLVNLEPALKASDSLGGHFVLGHVDGRGQVTEIIKHKKFIELKINYPKQLAHYLIEKGSIAVDGISLTINKLTARYFTVCLIPHTLQETNLGERVVGDWVNLEGDMLGKYVYRILKRRL